MTLLRLLLTTLTTTCALAAPFTTSNHHVGQYLQARMFTMRSGANQDHWPKIPVPSWWMRDPTPAVDLEMDILQPPPYAHLRRYAQVRRQETAVNDDGHTGIYSGELAGHADFVRESFASLSLSRGSVPQPNLWESSYPSSFAARKLEDVQKAEGSLPTEAQEIPNANRAELVERKLLELTPHEAIGWLNFEVSRLNVDAEHIGKHSKDTTKDMTHHTMRILELGDDGTPRAFRWNSRMLRWDKAKVGHTGFLTGQKGLQQWVYEDGVYSFKPVVLSTPYTDIYPDIDGKPQLALWNSQAWKIFVPFEPYERYYDASGNPHLAFWNGKDWIQVGPRVSLEDRDGPVYRKPRDQKRDEGDDEQAKIEAGRRRRRSRHKLPRRSTTSALDQVAALSSPSNTTSSSGSSAITTPSLSASLTTSRAAFAAYYSHFLALQSNITSLLLPIVQSAIARDGTNSTLIHDFAFQALAEIAAFPLLITGPFMYGKNCLPSIGAQLLRNANSTHPSIESLCAPGVANYTAAEVQVLRVWVTYESAWSVYNSTWTRGLERAKHLLPVQAKLMDYLLPEDERIMSDAFKTQIDHSYMKEFHWTNEPPTDAGR